MQSSNLYQSFLIADCGTTGTSVILIEEHADTYSLMGRGEAPTTTEPPYEDVTVGLFNAIRHIEESTGKTFIDKQGGLQGVDAFLCTSSVGGGLQMMVAGLVRIMTAESAERAALGAGAMVMDVIAIDDGRIAPQKVQRMRELRPDAVLLSGGIDDGNIDNVLELTEQIASAKLRPDLPVIFAGNIAAREQVSKILENRACLFFVDNVRPVLEVEVLEPAGREIHRRFLEHVVAHAPGYEKLAALTSAPILPTQGAIGYVIEDIAERFKQTVLGINIGDATTDVYSVFKSKLIRTVSGDLGLGTSISNSLKEAGYKKIARWLPFSMEEGEMRNRLRNKMLRQTTVAYELNELLLEHAVAKEVVRLAFEQHKGSVVGLRGVRRARDVGHIFDQSLSSDSLASLMDLDLLIGLGAIFAQAPRYDQALLILLDAIRPEGVTTLAIDQYSTASHLGMLSTLNREAAGEVFYNECLAYLGSAIAPVGDGESGEPCVEIALHTEKGTEQFAISVGSLTRLDIPQGIYRATIKPSKHFNVGKGPGRSLTTELVSGLCGIVVDTRGNLNHNDVHTWYEALNAYPLSKESDRQ
ncbi:MAG: hypothetical protein FD169_1317 [Bacillota bacterium]|nr:MAG: hypothetical protein FD169_1317 [Bacillota bacterium]